MRRALLDDIATLVALMAEFYAESDHGLDQPLAEKAFAPFFPMSDLATFGSLRRMARSSDTLFLHSGLVLSFGAPIEPAIRGVMKPLRSGVFGVSDRSLFTSF